MNRDAIDLSRLTFGDCVRHLRALGNPEGRPLRVAVVRSYTVEPIEPVLKLGLALEGYRASFWFGGYNQIAREILDEKGPLYAFAPDLLLVMTRIEEQVPGLVGSFGDRPLSEWGIAVDEAAHSFRGLLKTFVAACPSLVLVQNLTAPGVPDFSVLDAQEPNGQSSLIARFNQAIVEEAQAHRGVYVWDFDRFVRRIGEDNLFDPKMWYVSKNPFKQAVVPAMVADLMRYIRAALGQVKKCVVIDLDNTLWGGIAGEDGLEGVQLGHTYPGNCYRDLQRELLKLHRRGILLAVNSKNNEADALRIIDHHPEMVLRREHFAAIRINWTDKASNMRDLAAELGVGLDSLLFVDDNPVECELIRSQCPECSVIQLPGKPYLLPEAIRRAVGTDAIRLTAEDREKPSLYRARAERRALEEQTGSLESFLRSLDIEVRIDAATAYSISRVAQLTQKTNQLNVTTRRYTDAQVAALAAAPENEVFSVSVRDRFGDEGIVGVAILRYATDECLIDTLLLSCRVIGRGIEDALLSFIGERCAERGVARLVGEFIPTPKNGPASDIFRRAGFARQDERLWVFDLERARLGFPPHIRRAGEQVGHQ